MPNPLIKEAVELKPKQPYFCRDVLKVALEGLYLLVCRVWSPAWLTDVVSGRHHLTEELDLLDVD